MTNPESVTVEQGDEFAAFELLRRHPGIGASDKAIVQAFAAHRLASVSALADEVERYRGLLERWVEWSCGQRGQSPFQDTRAAIQGAKP